MVTWALRGLSLLLVGAGIACTADTPDEPPLCERGTTSGDAAAPPPGVQRGEPYRWLARSWRSPLGLTVRTYGIAVDGIPVFGRHQVEVYDRRGVLVHRAGTADAALSALHARGAAAWAAWRHPLAASGVQRDRRDPLAHTARRAVWHDAGGDLVAAVMTEHVDLRAEVPVAAIIVRDAVTGAELVRRNALYELGDPEYLVYARSDGRPLPSPLGDTLPHPTGVPDGRVPPLSAAQELRRQSAAVAALPDPWVAASGHHSWGNNVVAFFDSLRDASGNIADVFDDQGNGTPAYGPQADTAAGDFYAAASADRFAFAYDPTKTAVEYFQDGTPGSAVAAPDPGDVAINGKIVQAFYATNWLHDYFYRAGFDEMASNAQLSNLERGGRECDPLIVHASFLTTFTFPGFDGQSPVLDVGLNSRSASRRDSAMDFTVVAHEWGHTLIGRLAGGTAESDALGNLQGQALHEGLADFVGLLVNVSSIDAGAAYAIGSYTNLDYIERRPMLPPVEAPADAIYYGIRRYPYSLDFHKNPLTFRHIAEPPPAELPYYNWKGRGPELSEPHTTGEVFAEGMLQCFGNIVAAHPGTDFEDLRARMAQYLVAGLAAFPEHPSLLQARNAFLAVIRIASPTEDYPACRAGFAARGMGADALGPDGEFGAGMLDLVPYDPAQVAESFVDRDRALRLIGSSFAPEAADPARGTIRVELRNSGLVDLAASSIEIAASVPAAVVFPGGANADVGAIAPEQVRSALMTVMVDACLLPPHPTQAGFRAFDYTVTASSPGAEEVTQEVTYHAAVQDPVGGCVGGGR